MPRTVDSKTPRSAAAQRHTQFCVAGAEPISAKVVPDEKGNACRRRGRRARFGKQQCDHIPEKHPSRMLGQQPRVACLARSTQQYRGAGPNYPKLVIDEFAPVAFLEDSGCDTESVITCAPSGLPKDYATRRN